MKNKHYWNLNKFSRKRRNKLCSTTEDIINEVLEEEGITESPSDDSVEVVNNRIYFYSEVERGKILRFNKEIRMLDDLISSQSQEWTCPKDAVPIIIHINSGGGSLFDAFAAVDYIRKTRNPTISIIDGSAASAATIMSVVADKRMMNKHAYMLIHQLSSWHAGKYEELKDEMENCDILMKAIKKIYSEYCKIPNAKLKEILKRDLYFDAETCLKYGLVDEIID